MMYDGSLVGQVVARKLFSWLAQSWQFRHRHSKDFNFVLGRRGVGREGREGFK